MRTIGLILRIGRGLAFNDSEMGSPEPWLPIRPRTASRQERAELGKMLGEQLGKSRVGIVSGRRRQHHLRIGRDLDLARPASIVGQADAADLGIVLAPN
jgi:outer membrane lipopolysaccharide assembly protein LptE/RlpB